VGEGVKIQVSTTQCG